MAWKRILTTPMKEALLTIGDAYWLRGIRWNTKNALLSRGLIVREASDDRHVVGLTNAGVTAYFEAREGRQGDEP